jgi:putative hemolysin
MKENLWIGFTLLMVGGLFITGCGDAQATVAPPTATPPTSELANPAAAYCEVQGHTYEIRTAEDGGQYGVCIAAEGKECDAWALYRGECRFAVEGSDAPSQSLECPTGWMVYVNTAYGFLVCYPPGWTLNEESRAGAEGQAPRALTLSRDTLRLHIQYKRPEEAAILGPGGRGAGEIVEHGQIAVLGQVIPKHALLYEDKVKSVFGSVQTPDLDLYVQLDADSEPGVDYGAIALTDEAQAEVDAILATLTRTSSAP